MEHINLDGNDVAFVQGGSGDIELVFIHGIRNAAWVWQPALERLDPTRFRWTALDLPGCGASESPTDWNGCTIEANASLVLKLVERVCTSSPVLVGHSLGGGIAAQAALTKPDAITGIVLVAPTPFDGLDVAIDEVLGGAFAHRSDVEALGRAAFTEQPTQADFDRLVDTVLAASTQHIEGALRSAHSLRIRNQLASLSTPTMILAGDRDRHVRPAETYLTAAAFKRPVVQVWAGVGHVPHWERPDEFTALLEAFATKHANA